MLDVKVGESTGFSATELRLPPEVTRKLGFYVYLYVDPRDSEIFYVGKGVGKRLLAHLSEQQETKKTKRLAALKAKGLKPVIEVLAHQLPNEETALMIEAAVINALGLGVLTNIVRGWNSVHFGRQNLSQLRSLYAAPTAEVIHPLVLVRINKLYRHQMTELELYEAARGVWKMGDRRDGAKFACAVFESVVREVYQIEEWLPAGSVPYATRRPKDVEVHGRWEFVGQVAPPSIRDRYLNRSVAAHLAPKSRTAFTYVGC